MYGMSVPLAGEVEPFSKIQTVGGERAGVEVKVDKDDKLHMLSLRCSWSMQIQILIQQALGSGPEV